MRNSFLLPSGLLASVLLFLLCLTGCAKGTEPPATFAVRINATPDQGPVPLAVDFEAVVVGVPAIALDWYFGDGSDTVSGQQVSHTYVRVGTFTTTLLATDADGRGASANTTIRVEPSSANNPPTADDQSIVTPEDTPVDILLTGQDEDGDSLTFAVIDQPEHGTLAGTAPELSYTPDTDYFGADLLTFRVNDYTADSEPATIAIAITPVNDPPVITNTAALVFADPPPGLEDDIALAAQPVAADVDSDEVVFDYSWELDEGEAFTPVMAGTGVEAIPALPGTVTVYRGIYRLRILPFDYQDHGAEFVSASVTVANSAPTIVQSALTLLPSQPYTDDDLALEEQPTGYDADGDTVTFAYRWQHDGTGGTWSDLADEADNDVETIPPLDADRTVKNVSYRVVVTPFDGFNQGAPVTSTKVQVENSPPVAGDDTAQVAEDNPVIVTASTLLANDGDLDLDPLFISSIASLRNGSAETVVSAGAIQSITFTPATHFFGTAGFTYTVSDGAAADTADVDIEVTPVNDPPIAADDAVTGAEDVGLILSWDTLVANDSDIDSPSENWSVSAVGSAVNGAVSNDAVGKEITFAPTSDFFGAASFQYTLSDGDGGSDSATVTVTVTAVNDSPMVTANLELSADEGATTAITLDVLAAGDVDDPNENLVFTLATTPSLGTLQCNSGDVVVAGCDGLLVVADYFPQHFLADGYIRYSHLGAESPLEDGFTFTVGDGHGGVTPVTEFAITINPTNDPPVANDDPGYTTNECTDLVVNAAAGVLANDSDAEGGALTAVLESSPAAGVLSLAADGSFSYTLPQMCYRGTVSFTYRAQDPDGAQSSVATATIAIQADPSCPPAGWFRCANQSCIADSLVCNDTDDCGDGSDESDCGCAAGEFVCNDEGCIAPGEVCDGVADCGDGSDESAATCYWGAGTYSCDVSACKPSGWVCDGMADCTDNSDESSCYIRYICDNGNHTYTHWVCDHINDCGDNSDETGCSYQWTCDNGTKIPYSDLCNYWDNCGDNSDETTCYKRFVCDGDNLIPSSWVCDWIPDCTDGTDEATCYSTEIEDFFLCGSGEYYPPSYVCDGMADCSDGSDESHCYIRYVCDNGSHTYPHWVCDRMNDCTDGSDETYCDIRWTCEDTSQVEVTGLCNYVNNCGDGSDESVCYKRYLCASGLTLLSTQVCDGLAQCPDSADEAYCCCVNGDFRCTNGSCIPPSQLCNGADNCGDNSDETRCGG
ncbi:MAG: tandem-95 repeat protein [Bradymonadales bacterium]|nr:tandem-95 repeat protein [Bradymonadales bacterium]